MKNRMETANAPSGSSIAVSPEFALLYQNLAIKRIFHTIF